LLKSSRLALAVAALWGVTAASAFAQPSTDGSPAAAAAPTAASAPVFDRSGEDPAVRPQDDLYRAVNGRWLRDTPIPADKPTIGNFSILADRADGRIHTLLDQMATEKFAAGSNEAKISDFYRSFIDEAALDRAGSAPLRPWLADIHALHTARDVAALMGRWQGVVKTPLAIDVQPDQANPTMNLPVGGQSGLGLPNRDYYLSSDPRMAKARAGYLVYLQTLFNLAGDKHATRSARKVMEFEKKLAKAQWTDEANRNPLKTFNPTKVADLRKKAPGMDWAVFFDAASMKNLDRLNVSQPDYLAAVAKLVKTTRVATWKLYFQARLMGRYANVLSKRWRDADFAGDKVLYGLEVPPPRWQQGVEALNGALGEAVGQVYVEHYFPADHKARMQALVGNLLKAYAESIDGLSWMSPATKEQARIKLSKYTTKIGYPDKWRDYSGLEIKAGDALGNAIRAGRFEYERVAAEAGKPVDRTEWDMTPQTVNAGYDPTRNEIVFPAAILEPPFFDMAADDATNYGSIGAVIGHEISHGFDDQGSKYDGDGRLHDWWTPADAKAFAALTDRLVAQFNAYEPLPGHHVNGKLTLGENIADLSGLQIAYKAWKLSLNGKTAPVINGLTGDQRFFYSFARTWRSNDREEFLLWILQDVHSPSEFRANGAVINSDAFHKAFGTKPGDKMWKPEDQRIRIW
jgi:putative endopeptidase